MVVNCSPSLIDIGNNNKYTTLEASFRHLPISTQHNDITLASFTLNKDRKEGCKHTLDGQLNFSDAGGPLG